VEADARPALASELASQANSRYAAFLDGLTAYRHHPYRRNLPDPPVLWAEGGTRLLDFGPAEGRPVLLVPSLVNRHYVLDLAEGNSLARWLAGQGVRPLLVDWGWPDEAARAFTLTDYVAGRLDRALDAALAANDGGSVGLAGYCMGGLLAAALALRRGEAIDRLVFLATPWDFHAEAESRARALGASLPLYAPVMQALGYLPIDAIQALFLGLDPWLGWTKFRRFAGLDPDSDQAKAFVALEDWLNDGVPLAAPVAAECLAGWYGANSPARADWRIAGEAVDPARLTQPSLHLIPRGDRIVPPGSARALAEAMPQARVEEPPLGHIGMVVSSRARQQVWPMLAAFLASAAAGS
jgi:polyhydroxyalkanoate synthase